MAKSLFGFNNKVITPEAGIGRVIAAAETDGENILSYMVQYGKADCVGPDGRFDQEAWLKLCPTNGPTCIRKVAANSIIPIVDKVDRAGYA